MNEIYILIYLIALSADFFVQGQDNDGNKCFISNTANSDEYELLIKNISSIVGKRFVTQKNGYDYALSICSDVSKQQKYVSVTRTKDKDILVIGRRNDTHIIGGDTWLILKYGSGDMKAGDKKCLDQMTATIFIVCHPEHHNHEPQLEFIQEDGCDHEFILGTSVICKHDDDMSGFSIFLIIIAVSFSMYCLIGVTYRRFVHNAQHCQQIPHFKFWSRIGSSLADACNYVCRCDAEDVDSWSNIASNFDSGDRDDALLRP